MIALALFIAALVLFFGFLLLTGVEKKRGTRFFSRSRAKLDAKVARVDEALRHVDFSAFVWHLAKDIVGRIVHDIAHVSLIVVRSLERLLTRIVRYMRGKVVAQTPTTETRASAFVETVTYVKKTLRRSKQAPEAEKEENV